MPFSNSEFYNFDSPIKMKSNFEEQNNKNTSQSLVSIRSISDNPSEEAAYITKTCSEQISNEIYLLEMTSRHEETNTHVESTDQQPLCTEELVIDLISTNSDTQKVQHLDSNSFENTPKSVNSSKMELTGSLKYR